MRGQGQSLAMDELGGSHGAEVLGQPTEETHEVGQARAAHRVVEEHRHKALADFLYQFAIADLRGGHLNQRTQVHGDCQGNLCRVGVDRIEDLRGNVAEVEGVGRLHVQALDRPRGGQRLQEATLFRGPQAVQRARLPQGRRDRPLYEGGVNGGGLLGLGLDEAEEERHRPGADQFLPVGLEQG